MHKVKSHQQLQDTTTNYQELLDIQGNTLADKAAVACRLQDSSDFDTLIQSAETFYTHEKQSTLAIWQYLIDLNKFIVQLRETNKKIKNKEGGQSPPLYGTFVDTMSTWSSMYCTESIQGQVHPMVLKSCIWEHRIAHAIWAFAQSIRWPPIEHTPEACDPGITWTELAVSFMLTTGIRLPIWISHTRWNIEALDPTDQRIQVLPSHKRSLKLQAEAFRLILRHIEHFAKICLISKYKLQDAKSLERLGFKRQICGCMPYRPIVLKAKETMQAIVSYQSESHQNPSYHTDAPFSLHNTTPDIVIASYSEIQFQQRYKLEWKVWNAKRKNISFDTICDPFGT